MYVNNINNNKSVGTDCDNENSDQYYSISIPRIHHCETIKEWRDILSSDKSLHFIISRPWAQSNNRTKSGCIGKDYCIYENAPFTIDMWWSQTNQSVFGVVNLTVNCEGAPTFCHGAAIAAIFDEVLAIPPARLNIPAVTKSVTILYKRSIKIPNTIAFEVHLKSIKINSKGKREIESFGHLISFSENKYNSKITHATATGIWCESGIINSLIKANL